MNCLKIDEKLKIGFEEFTKIYFLPWYKGRVKMQSYKSRYKIILNNFKCFNEYNLDEIKPMTVQNWQIETSKRLQPSTLKIIQNLLSMIMDRAVALELLEVNPVAKIGNMRIEKKEMKIWTMEEFQKVIKQFNQDDYYEYYLFTTIWLLFMTGICIGEAGALKWENIDFETGKLTIQKTLIYKNKSNYRLSTPKTKVSHRTFKLDEVTLKILKDWKLKQQKYCQNNFVLSYFEEPLNRRNIKYALDKYSKNVDIHRIRLHDLRHSHASLLINLGKNSLIIKERLGHCEVKTTLGTYGHLYPSAHNTVADKLTSLVSA